MVQAATGPKSKRPAMVKVQPEAVLSSREQPLPEMLDRNKASMLNIQGTCKEGEAHRKQWLQDIARERKSNRTTAVEHAAALAARRSSLLKL